MDGLKDFLEGEGTTCSVNSDVLECPCSTEAKLDELPNLSFSIKGRWLNKVKFESKASALFTHSGSTCTFDIA